MATPIIPKQLPQIYKPEYKNIKPLLKTVDIAFAAELTF